MTRTIAAAAATALAALVLLAACSAHSPEDIAADTCRNLAAEQLGGGRGIATDVIDDGDHTFTVLGENNAAMFQCTVKVPDPGDPDSVEARITTD